MSNRLADEPSPYLRLHADNPVDWYPWGAEALDRARDEDKPILLSVGYAACHWCHVMARESFEDAETAAYMNEHFVNVKVDREERPDIDAIYIEAAQAISGQAGWPLTAFLTPSQAPFFAGTYFPPEPRADLPSFRQLLNGIVEAWAEQRAEIEEGRDRTVQALSAMSAIKPSVDEITREAVDEALFGLAQEFDPIEGGFGGAPKFPPHSVVDFLLGVDDPGYRDLALITLRKMAAGGIHDQLGGGFSRYSVDGRWHVPHFEKMLYDNAMLARNHLHAWQVTGEADFERVCRSTLDWLIAELRGDEGGFAGAMDADSPDEHDEHAEGGYYTWSRDELASVARDAAGEQLDDLLAFWGVSDDAEFAGDNVLRVAEPDRRPSADVLEAACRALRARRSERTRPALDDKRITSWNALAIAALAEAGGVLREPRYTDAAVACAEFVERELREDDGRLRRFWLDGRSGPPGYLEDHAFVTAAYLTLFEHTFDARWFDLARVTADRMIELFEDPEGGFFTTAADHERLLVRRKDMDDNPLPGGNAAAAFALLRLAALTGEAEYRHRGELTLRMLSGMAARYPSGFGHTLQAIDFLIEPVKEIALVDDDRGGDETELRAVLNETFDPRRVVAGGHGDVPLLRDRTAVDGRATAYVCSNFTCRRPVTSTEDLRELLSG